MADRWARLDRATAEALTRTQAGRLRWSPPTGARRHWLSAPMNRMAAAGLPGFRPLQIRIATSSDPTKPAWTLAVFHGDTEAVRCDAESARGTRVADRVHRLLAMFEEWETGRDPGSAIDHL